MTSNKQIVSKYIEGEVMGITLRTKLFLLVIISISMAAVPIIFSAYEDFRSSNLELERKAFRSVATFVKEGLESRYFDILTYQAKHTLQAKNQLRRTTTMLESNLHMLEKFPSKQQSVFLNEWVKKLQEFNIHVEIFSNNKTLIQNKLFAMLQSRGDIKDVNNRSLSSLLEYKNLPAEGIFTVFDNKALSTSDPILAFFFPSPQTQRVIVTAIHISDISKDALDTENQLVKVIQEKIQSFTLHKNGFISVFNSDGVLIAHKGNKTGEKTNFIPKKALEEARNNTISEEVVSLNKDESILLHVAYFKSLEWYIVAAAPQSEIEAPTRALIHQLIGIALAAILNSLLVTLILTAKLITPLQALTEKALTLAELDFASPEAEELATQDLPTQRSDEVGQLARAFSMMGKTLTQNIRELMETTTIKERMLGELNAAKEIQIGILPTSDKLSSVSHYETSSFLEPAKEVGGDFYDFFTSPEGKQVVVIGDVSGKGIPAALFMSMTVTLIRYAVGKGLSPAEVAKEINEVLNKNNPSCMFVTLFIGIFDPETGLLEYVNCGHCLPYIMNAHNHEQALLVETEQQSPIVGVLEDAEYVNIQTQLKKGDIWFLYTDGVTEAMNESLELYGNERLKNTLEINRKKSLKGIIAAVNQSINNHRGKFEQSDDITMLSFSYK